MFTHTMGRGLENYWLTLFPKTWPNISVPLVQKENNLEEEEINRCWIKSQWKKCSSHLQKLEVSTIPCQQSLNINRFKFCSSELPLLCLITYLTPWAISTFIYLKNYDTSNHKCQFPHYSGSSIFISAFLKDSR